MSLLSALLSLMIFVQYTLLPSAVFAAGPSGSAAVRNNKIGNLIGEDMTAIFQDNTVQIQSGGKTVLEGVIAVTGQQGKTAKGFVYFRQGDSLVEIDDPDTEEMISIYDGGVIAGKITSVNSESMTVGGRTVEWDKVKKICSPKIFAFTMPMVDGEPQGKITLKRTAKACRGGEKGTQSNGNPRLCCFGFAIAGNKPDSRTTSSSSTGKVVAIALAMTLVAAAIAIPIAVAVPLATRSKKKPPQMPFFPVTQPQQPQRTPFDDIFINSGP